MTEKRSIGTSWVIAALAAAALGWMAATPALAIDCAKAGNAVEKKICGDASLKKADEAMGKAYAALVQTAPDREIHDLLVASQRRWVQARDQGLDNFNDENVADKLVRDAIVARTRVLNDRTDKGLIARAQAHRRFLSKYTGGNFTGFSADCEFIPADREGSSFSYECFGTASVQNKDQVCSLKQDWASWSLSIYYGVSTVKGGDTQPAAFCNAQDAGGVCGDGDDAGWKRGADAAVEDFPGPVSGPKLDAEFWPFDADDETWLDKCLTTPGYPAKP